MGTKKNKKSDNWYRPSKWFKAPSEKRLVALKMPEKKLSKKEQDRTTDKMNSQHVNKLQKTFHEESIEEEEVVFDFDDKFETVIDVTEYEDDYKIYKVTKKTLRPRTSQKLKAAESLFDHAEDVSHKTVLHSRDSKFSEMIAVERKDISGVRKAKINTRTKWLIIIHWFKRLFVLFISLG